MNKRCSINDWGILFLLFADLIMVTQADPKDVSRCPKNLGRTRYLRAASGWNTCYEFHMEERTWKTASIVCGRRGGNLVTIKTAQVQSFLMNSLKELRWPRNGLWIGATDKAKEMTWRWITGELVSDGYSKWGSGQPSCGFLCFEDCAVMRWRDRGRWHDYRCNWLEDYSFVCEFDMLPPTTTSTTTTTTTTTTTSTTTSTTTTTTQEPSSTTNMSIIIRGNSINSDKALKSGNLQRYKDKNQGTKNKTNPDIAPIPYVQGSNAQAGHVKQVDTSDSAGLSTGALAGLILGILIGMSAAICLMVFLLFARRRKKEQKEDDVGIRYSNPYYGEVKPPVTAVPNNGSDTEYEDDEDLVTPTSAQISNSSCADFEGAVGGVFYDDMKKLLGTPEKPERGRTSVKQPPLPPSPLHVRPKCVMNQYDTPPTLLGHKPAAVSEQQKKKTTFVRSRLEFLDEPQTAEAGEKSQVMEENYYDEIHPHMLPAAYDIPPNNTKIQNFNRVPSSTLLPKAHSPEELYYNEREEENLYESMENLRAAVEQHKLNLQSQAAESTTPPGDHKDSGNIYVPFALDAANEQ